jgi:hypothetical protein
MSNSRQSRKSTAFSRGSWNTIKEISDSEPEFDDTNIKNINKNSASKISSSNSYISKHWVINRSANSAANLNRTKSANSIPSKNRYSLAKYPNLSLEYELPNSPEKYLIPIRFPNLYKNIVKSLSKIKSNKWEIKMDKYSHNGILIGLNK